MAEFEKTHWNLIQTLAWIYLRDRKIVIDADDSTTNRGVFYEEVKMPDGATQMVPRPIGKPNPISLSLHGSSDNIVCYESFTVASEALSQALVNETVHAWGIANGHGDLQRIPADAWLDLKFYFEPDFAAPKDLSRPGSTKWYGLKFLRTEVVELWPDPYDDAAFERRRSGKPAPSKHDLSIAEALSWLAWGEAFTRQHFQLADGLSSYRDSLQYFEELHAKTLERFNAERAKIPGEPTIADHPEVFGLASQCVNVSKHVEEYRAEVARAETAKRKLENASGRFLYESRYFFQHLVKAQTELFEAVKAGTVTALAKASADDPDWQVIPPRWFWPEPAPTSELAEGVIQRNSNQSPNGVMSRWLDVRFERPQILALRIRTEVSRTAIATHRTRENSGAKRRWSEAKAKNWYRGYVQEHQSRGTIPNRDDDWKVAKKEVSPDITRDAVRDLRDQFAPAEWRRQGRRKTPK